MKQLCTTIFLLAGAGLLSPAVQAQDNAELAKQLANPIASLICSSTTMRTSARATRANAGN